MSMELSEQEIIRRKKLDDFANLGINSYPAPLYPVNANSAEIKEKYPQDNTLFQDVCLAGRIMKQRIMGAVSFYELQDAFSICSVSHRLRISCIRDEKYLFSM